MNDTGIEDCVRVQGVERDSNGGKSYTIGYKATSLHSVLFCQCLCCNVNSIKQRILFVSASNQKYGQQR